jgi:hypothetical protein
LLLESLLNLALSLKNNLGPSPASLNQRFQFILTGKRVSISINEVAVLLSCFDLLQLLAQIVDFGGRELK